MFCTLLRINAKLAYKWNMNRCVLRSARWGLVREPSLCGPIWMCSLRPQVLLSKLVNKVGDPDRKVATKAAHLLRCMGMCAAPLLARDVERPVPTPSPPHRNFVTGPQSPICHQFKMAPVNTVHRIDWDRQLRRLHETRLAFPPQLLLYYPTLPYPPLTYNLPPSSLTCSLAHLLTYSSVRLFTSYLIHCCAAIKASEAAVHISYTGNWNLDSLDCVRLQLDHNASLACNHNALRHLTS